MSLMNSFWNLFDWIFPAIRLSDDLRLDDVEALAGRSYAIHTRTLSTPARLQYQARPQATDAERYRQRERRKDVAERDIERESELVGSLRKENEELRARIRELEKSLDFAERAVSYAREVSVPALRLNVRLPTPPEAPPSATPAALQTAYAHLRTSHASVQQALRERDEEVSSLRTFLTKTDDMSGHDLMQAIRDLNSEIVQLAASITDAFADTFDRRNQYARSSDRDRLYPALGEPTTTLLEEHDHLSDPTFVQFAIQAWEVVCVGKVMTPFCFGVQTDIQKVLSAVFQRIQESEPQATASRWRALTHAHLREYLLVAETSSTHAPPPTPISSSTPTSSSHQPKSVLTKVLETHVMDNIRGLISILALAGCSEGKRLHFSPIQDTFGPGIARISDRAYKLAVAFREGVMSSAFEVVIVPPSGGTWSRMSSKGGGLTVEIPGEVKFDSNTMLDAFADPTEPSHEREDEDSGTVLCTVELGLACVQRVEALGDGPIARRTDERSLSRERFVPPETDETRTTNGIQRTDSSTSSFEIPVKTINRNLLVQPKVILSSVTQYLQS